MRSTTSPVDIRDALLASITAENWKGVADQLADLRRQHPIAPFSPSLFKKNKLFIIHYVTALSVTNPSALLVLKHLVSGYKAYFEGELTWKADIKQFGYLTPAEMATKINNQAIQDCLCDRDRWIDVLNTKVDVQAELVDTLTIENIQLQAVIAELKERLARMTQARPRVATDGEQQAKLIARIRALEDEVRVLGLPPLADLKAPPPGSLWMRRHPEWSRQEHTEKDTKHTLRSKVA